jgi:mRNA interferase MazF
LDERTKTRGHVLCRHIRALDLFERQAEVVEQVPDDILRKCISYVKLLISCDEEEN